LSLAAIYNVWYCFDMTAYGYNNGNQITGINKEFIIINKLKYFSTIIFMAVTAIVFSSCSFEKIGGTIIVKNGSGTESYYVRVFLKNVPDNASTIANLSKFPGEWYGQVAPLAPGEKYETGRDGDDFNFVVYWGTALDADSVSRIEGRISGGVTKTFVLPYP